MKSSQFCQLKILQHFFITGLNISLLINTVYTGSLSSLTFCWMTLTTVSTPLHIQLSVTSENHPYLYEYSDLFLPEESFSCHTSGLWTNSISKACVGTTNLYDLRNSVSFSDLLEYNAEARTERRMSEGSFVWVSRRTASSTIRWRLWSLSRAASGQSDTRYWAILSLEASSLFKSVWL